ncbi:hypothetical protein K437DRAFT_232002 [Tilletiaria anomala UBC 951]|uniref:RING-type E3 ubiquitin transferase (cysteine targeting) n=1 Tax=Tilletiaria anomala (strain ATCC 24038 / CBS 436.72 / UBC 951) TaxID=1037660 RepID=A0A066WF69_TILAU|nr:uncharacterized protein K437DRAFT_232002 [Tilletiaria anomala UBC 951]KDN52627.1 hypothetical protein K437DRAFT_232002 [Tilletiaria anomala UBC 951]
MAGEDTRSTAQTTSAIPAIPAIPATPATPNQFPSQLPVDLDLEAFWEARHETAKPSIESLRRRLSHFPSPPLRIQRVGQLDADLLDRELLEILLAPMKDAVNLIQPTLTSRILPEMLLVMRLALFKLSIIDHQASYGSMLQNLKYRNEWAHRGGLQSTSRDRKLSIQQLVLYPLITAIVPYAYARSELNMAQHPYSELPTSTTRHTLWNLMDRFRRWYTLAAFINFGLFLGNGKYRTLADRILGIRLIYAKRTVHRNVSFEYLNRQLVWHALTEFLVFLLPLLKPRRILKYLTRLPICSTALGRASKILPRVLRDRTGLSTPLKGSGNSDGEAALSKVIPEIAALPISTCALCWQRYQASQGGSSGVLRVGLPTSDPLDPASGALASRGNTLGKPNTASDDLIITIPYAADPCGCLYCYHCLASILLSEEAADDISDEGGWRCLRCSAIVRGLKRA